MKITLTIEEMKHEILLHEKTWFVNGMTRKEIKDHLRSKHNAKIGRRLVSEQWDNTSQKYKRVYACEFVEALRDFGRFYGLRKKSSSPHLDLDSNGWDRLQAAVRSILPELSGLTMAQGFELLRTRIRTNLNQINGLPRRLQWWA